MTLITIPSMINIIYSFDNNLYNDLKKVKLTFFSNFPTQQKKVTFLVLFLFLGLNLNL